MSKIGSAIGWISFALILCTLLSLYWFYFTPTNQLEGIMAVSFCLVTAWVLKIIVGVLYKRT